MKTVTVAIAVFFALISAQATSIPNPYPSLRKVDVLPNNCSVQPECTFTASVAINIVGQTASVTCTSNQSSCDVAINDVARCIKLAKTRLQAVFGL